MVTNLRIAGMSCNHCVRTVGDALRGLRGVSKVDVRLPDRAEVVHDGSLTFEQMAKAVESAGYEASEIALA